MATAIQAVFFDLDGTLLDTAPDLAYCLNQSLQRHGRPSLSFEQIRPHVSHGTHALLRAGFGLGPEDPGFAELRDQLLAIYQANLSRHSRLFAGMDDLLQQLEQRDIAWGIVTNKPAFLTDPLAAELGLDRRCRCIISGDTLPQAKPHPAPILHACALAGAPAEACLYVGDAERDIQAGRAAGVRTLAASWGYLGENDRIQDWQADAIIDSPLEILDWLD
ncbi:MAG: HAD-IA family hydrolase [Gammaproteobacteria bacterium]|nr:HAD-IA family hydrolase [Gammaproteobacteria bacterium]